MAMPMLVSLHFYIQKKENTGHLTGLLGELRKQRMKNSQHSAWRIANLHPSRPPPTAQMFGFVSAVSLPMGVVAVICTTRRGENPSLLIVSEYSSQLSLETGYV